MSAADNAREDAMVAEYLRVHGLRLQPEPGEVDDYATPTVTPAKTAPPPPPAAPPGPPPPAPHQPAMPDLHSGSRLPAESDEDAEWQAYMRQAFPGRF
jgi:hypothetical protein